jgi:lysophospholipase L1-like esterase
MFVSRRCLLRNLCALAAPSLLAENTAPAVRAPDRPMPISEPGWFRRISEHQALLTNNRYDVVFLGDSLTDFWTATGKDTWQTQLVPLKSVDCGIAADRTEHVLWRIQQYDFHRAQPKVFVLLIGTNNLAMDPPDKPQDVARTILNTARQLSTKHVQAKVVVLTIPPNGPEPNSALRQRIKQTNALLEAEKLPPNLSVLPIYSTFVDDGDRWLTGMTLDGTHFSAAGYAKLAEILLPRIKDLLGAK